MNINITFLYVEDEDEIRKQLSKFFRYFSNELFVANNGQEGLELYKKHLPDIIITDINMPKMNGIDMIKTIKETNPKQHIIFTTAHSDSEYFIDAIDMQVDGYILKPVDFNKLEEKLENIIEQIKTKKELLHHQVLSDEITQLQDNILFVLDKKQEVIFSNHNFLKFFNIDTIDDFNSTNKSISDLFVEDHDCFYPIEDENWLDSLMQIKNEKKRVVSILNKNNKLQTFIILLKFIEKTSHFIITFTEITNITIEKKEFEQKAYTDKLTNIPNRAYFEDTFVKEIAMHKVEKTPLSFIILDIDDFKYLNDKYGHLLGDKVLIELTQNIKTHIRRTDIFARWGGEEFVCILPNTSLLNAKKLAKHLRKNISTNIFTNDLKITCSFGVAEFSEDDTKQTIIKRADEALYKAKKNGKNRVE